MTRILTIIALLFATPAWAESNFTRSKERIIMPCELVDSDFRDHVICLAKDFKVGNLISGQRGTNLLPPEHHDATITGFFWANRMTKGGSLFVWPTEAPIVMGAFPDGSLALYNHNDTGFQHLGSNFNSDFSQKWFSKVGVKYFFGENGEWDYLDFTRATLLFEARQQSNPNFSIKKFEQLFEPHLNFRLMTHISTNRTYFYSTEKPLGDPAGAPAVDGGYAYVQYQGEVRLPCGNLYEFIGKTDADLMPEFTTKNVNYCKGENGKVKRRRGIRATRNFEKHVRAALSLAQNMKEDIKQKLADAEKDLRNLSQAQLSNEEIEEANQHVIYQKQMVRLEKKRLRLEAEEAERFRVEEAERLRLEAEESQRLYLAEQERLREAAEKEAKLARDRKTAPLRAKCDGFGYKRETPQFNQCVSDQEALLELREVTISKRQEKLELQRLEKQRQEKAKIEQLKAIERATRETNARIARAQEQANRQAEEQRRMQANQNLMNLGLSIMNNGLGNQGYSAPPSMPRAGTTGCFLKGSYVSGFNRICNYNCTGSGASHTIGATDICPTSR